MNDTIQSTCPNCGHTGVYNKKDHQCEQCYLPFEWNDSKTDIEWLSYDEWSRWDYK